MRLPTLRRAPLTRTAVLATLLGTVAAGCSTTPDEPDVITAWFHSGQGGERDVLEQQVRAYNAANDTQVVVEVVPEGDYTAAVEAAAADGSLPCLLDVDGPNLTPYVAAGWVRPLDDLVSDDLVADLLPSIVEQGTVGDRLHGIGAFDSGLGLWANRAHLDAAGVRIPTGVDDAWDLAEFEAALAALQALPEVEHALDLKLNYGAGEWFTYGFAPIVWGFGGDIVDTSTEPATASGALDSDGTVAALSWLAGLVDAGYVDGDQTTDDDFHVARTSSLSWVGHWMWEPHRTELGQDLALLPLPRFPQAHTTGQGSWQWTITESCPSPTRTADFLDHLLSVEEVLRTTAVNGAVPARTSALASSDLYAVDGPLRVYVDQLTGGIARPRPSTADYPAVTAAFADAVAAVLDGETAADVLPDAARALDESIADG